MEYSLRKAYTNHFGVDLKSSDLNRPLQFASGMLNAQYRQSGSPEKRKGYQGHAANAGGYGQWTYERVNPTTGAKEPEVVKIDQNLYKQSSATITITYAGLAATCIVSVYLDTTTSHYKCEIIESTTTVLSYDLGVGFDEASPITLANLKTQVDALAGFSSVISGTTTTPAAFLKIIRAYDLVASGPATLTAKYFGAVNATTTNPLSTYYAARAGVDFENVSAVQVQNCMYFGSGYNETMKYDGQTFYRAGLPTPATLTSALAAGAITGNNYIHRAQYIQYDNAGNIIEGNLRSVSTARSPAGQSVDVVAANVLAGTGFNTNCALVNGNQAGVTTITVTNSPHTMKVGDTAYFLDRSSSTYVTRAVTAVTATTVVIAGAAVNVNNADVISNNLRIAIFRNKTSAVTPTVFYKVVEVPNNSFAATQTYNDNIADASLGIQLVEPATDRTPPPKGKYVSQWNGILMLAGVLTDPNTLFFSDIDGPEYFPADTNALLIESGAQDIITGIAPNNEVFAVLGGSSFTVVSGDILTGQLRIETKARDTGCEAHATLAEVDGFLCWLSSRGPRYSSGGQVPQPLGPSIDANRQESASRIDPEFENFGRSDIEKFKLKRAVGFSDTFNQNYLLFVPAETTTGGFNYPNSNSRVYAYQKSRDAWLVWSNLNFAGGVSILTDEFYFSERRYSTFASAVQSIMYRRHNLEDAWDYADNVTYVDWDYASQWDPLGEPSVLKSYLKLRAFALEDITNNEFTITVNQEVNYQRDVTKAMFTLAFSGGGYGVSPYGTTAYGDPAESATYHSLARDRVRSCRFRFTNQTVHENVVLTGWEVQAVTPYKPEFKP